MNTETLPTPHASEVAQAPNVRELPLGSVRLANEAVFTRAADQMLHLARVYPVDRLLAVFRRNAGLDTRGALPPGTWEDFGHPNEEAWSEADYPGREQAQTANLLRGHFAGHFLSMLSIASAAHGDESLRAKVAEFVDGLGEVQEALAKSGRYSHPGFLAAYGEWQFSRLESYAPYGEIWAPYYTTHKIMAGLIDAYELAGSTRALEIVTAMGHWIHARLERLSAEQRQRMWGLYIAGEFGGMNETMARLSVLAAEPKFLETATFFDQQNLLEAGSRGEDILTDMHANQHLPQLIGYVREYELTGDARYLDAVAGLWEQIVPGRTYAHGGNGESELWGPPNTVAGDIGHRNAETCVTYNMLKIARSMFEHTLDARYLEYAEGATLNHILGSRRNVTSDVSPEVTYMFPVHAGAIREYDNVGTCCGGTGLENHVSYSRGIAFAGEGALWIAQLIAADIDWQEGGLSLRVDSKLPLGGETAITVTEARTTEPRTLRVRVPRWVQGRVTATIGADSVSAEPGGFLEVTRVWQAADRLEFTTPLNLRAEATVDDESVKALFLGPTLLMARSEATTQLTFPFDTHRQLNGSLSFDRDAAALAAELADRGTVTLDGVEFEPCWSGADTKYHMYSRAFDRVVSFGGQRTDVPNRVRPDGGTLMSAVWSGGGFDSAEAFVERVVEVALDVRREGLLSRDEFAELLEAALATSPGLDSDVTRSAALERFDAIEHVPSAVAIEAATEPGASGWYQAFPEVSLRVFDLAGAVPGSAELHPEYSIDDGEWRPYEGAFVLDAQGAHVVRARVTDERGLTGFASHAFSIDTEAPEATAVVKNLGSSVEITLRAEDTVSGVERIQWEGPGTFWATFQEAFVRALTAEEQVLEFAATDRAGNEGERVRLVLPPRG